MSDPELASGDDALGGGHGSSFMQSTQSIKNRQKPRKAYEGRPRARMRTVGAGGVLGPNTRASPGMLGPGRDGRDGLGGGLMGEGGRGGRPAPAGTLPETGPSNPTLANIESVLDRMSERMAEVEGGQDLGTAEQSNVVMGSLIGMVNNVMKTHENQ